MSGTVLIATPARMSTPEQLLARAQELASRLTYRGGMERALHLNEQGPGPEKFAPNARARNGLIGRYLKAWHQWVLWIDADIIEYPADLIEQLMGISRRNGRAIVAPMVWMERVREGEVSIPNGGWFYDTGGFVDAEGRYADFAAGVDGPEDEIEMQSVGCVYLAPAELYRQGCRYAPVGNEVEHLSFMRQARELGTRVLATRRVNVTHAYLPKYGEAWTHEAMRV